MLVAKRNPTSTSLKYTEFLMDFINVSPGEIFDGAASSPDAKGMFLRHLHLNSGGSDGHTTIHRN